MMLLYLQALFGSPEAGFDPGERRIRGKRGRPTIPRVVGEQTAKLMDM